MPTPSAEIEIRLESRTTLGIDLYDEEERLPSDEGWLKKCRVVRARTNQPIERKVGWTSKGLAFDLDAPGTFLISFPELDGYQQLPQQTITVRGGERSRTRIALRRGR